MSTALAAARAKTKGKRLLRDALEAYGEDEYTLSEWNALKKQAEHEGKWRWKASDATATLAAVKERVEKDRPPTQELQSRFATDLDAVMATELHAPLMAAATTSTTEPYVDNQCGWRERIGGKQYCCKNELPPDKSKQPPRSDTAKPARRFCLWHARECVYSDHTSDRSRVIEIANEYGYCLTCYEATAVSTRATLQKTPPRLPSTRVPGVSEVDLKRDAVRESLLRRRQRQRPSDQDSSGLSRHLTASSVCRWEKEHSESAFVWRCRNKVLMHPTLRGAFLPFCGFHAPRCIHEYGVRKGAACPALEDRRNTLGMCRHHVEAHLATLPFEARAAFAFADSEFDVPGVVECRRDRLTATPKRHPLAPKSLPDSTEPAHVSDELVPVKTAAPPSRWQRLQRTASRLQRRLHDAVASVVGPAVASVLNHGNPLSLLLKEALWQLHFRRRAALVATRIQRIHRGNRARRRVRALHWEREALRRLAACRQLQRVARGYLGRLAFAQEAAALRSAVPNIQRVMRGALARRRCRLLRAALRIQRNYRAYRQRWFAWALREEAAYMASLQRQADANVAELELQLRTFRRLRARRVLRAHVARWRQRKAEHAWLAFARLQLLLATVKVQRAFRRHQYYQRLMRRYASARCIQARVRGWLTRHMWALDPGVLWVVSSVNARSGFEYGKCVVLHQPSGSYAFPSRRVRMQCGAAAIQRVYRGFMGRMAANMRWVAMLRRWEWLQLDSVGSDAMAAGHERYGFLLPSHKYHREKRRHMLPIQRGLKPDRGFAYKYQSILELIQDRDGKRAWSLAREEQWRRQQRQTPPTDKAESPTKPRRQRSHIESASDKAVGMPQALYPVGSVVLVASTMRRASQRFHKARVLAVRCDATRETNSATLDVEYIRSFLSVRGVRVYNEKNVLLARIRPLDSSSSSRRQRPLGDVIKKAIDRLKGEIKESQQRRFAPPTTDSGSSERDEDGGTRLPTVDAIADRLRDENPLTDLLIDHRDFVNFVFQNSTLLRVKWLQVIDHVRYGTRAGKAPLSPPRRASSQPLTPSLVAFYKSFGFTTPPSAANTAAIVPMPERAAEIERRMSQLGFLHEPSANVRDEAPASTTATDQRPHTTPANSGEKEDAPTASHTRDDSVLDTASSSPSSAQDLHRLIYELKALPRERHREKIIEVTTRHARSFICGFPACGRCFSSHEAARLHQEGVHLHQRRLASATPMVDQYMHAYWPPQSPWNQEHHRSFAPSVGYFRCSDCHDGETEFRTRRELQRHVLQAHGRRSCPSKPVSAVSRPLEVDRSMNQSAATASDLHSVMWLGAFTLCRSNLQAKLPGFPPKSAWHGSDAVYCDTHARVRPDPERCRACFLQTRRLQLPCRLYRAAAVPGRRRIVHREEEDPDRDGYIVLSVEDATFCPVVREQDLVALDEDDAQRQKRLMRQELARKAKRRQLAVDPMELLVFLRVEALCRDANGANWAIGHVYRPPKKPVESSYAVELDDAHVVAVTLEDVRATCVVHRCTTEAFHADPSVCKDDPVELKPLCEPLGGKSEAQRWIHVTLDRFLWSG